jgi:hypothetical protein
MSDLHIPYLDGPRDAAEQALVDAAKGRQQNADTLAVRIDQAVANLELAYDNWATLTQNQKDQALRLSVRVAAALARLQLRKLDSPG